MACSQRPKVRPFEELPGILVSNLDDLLDTVGFQQAVGLDRRSQVEHGCLQNAESFTFLAGFFRNCTNSACVN